MSKRVEFSNKFAVVAATVGSAVGLGNIWRFPYELGSNGGFAFLLIYAICVCLLGMPVVLSELVVGRRTQKNGPNAFAELNPNGKWWVFGILGVLTSFVILSYYFVVAGWSLEYVWQALLNKFDGQTPDQLAMDFANFSMHPYKPIIWAIVFVLLTAFVLFAGVKNGIEKVSKVLMPLLFVIILVLCLRSVTLPNSSKGLLFLFKPDFSKITGEVLLSALGQSFYSLSIGMGCLITYGSYVSKKNNLMHTTMEVSLLDTLVSLLVGIAIFPAVFSLGIAPNQGPELVFITLPSVFVQIPGGYVWAILFFLLLAVAALTSTISLMEVVVTYLVDRFGWKRWAVITILSLVFFCTCSLSSLSMGAWTNELTWGGKSFFDWLDFVSAKILLPIGGFFVSIFLGWRYDRKELLDEVSNGGKLAVPMFKSYIFLLRYFVPLAIVVIFVGGLL